MPQAVILDIDGTLVSSSDAHAPAWVDAYAEFRYHLEFERVQPLIGMGGDKLMAALTPGLSEKEGVGKQISERRAEIFKERYAPDLQPAPGSRALVQHMRDRGLVLVVASSAKKDELDLLLKAAQVDDLVQQATTSDDAEQSKPDPDIVQVALDKLDMKPDQVVMLGDTPYDVEAAGKARVGVVALRCGGHGDEELAGALTIHDDPADLLARYDESPLNRGAAVSAPGSS